MSEGSPPAGCNDVITALNAARWAASHGRLPQQRHHGGAQPLRVAVTLQ